MIGKGNSRILVIFVVILLLTNVGMLYYFTLYGKEPSKTREERQVEFWKNELKLDDSQLKQYLDIRAKRESIIEPLNDSIRVGRMEMISFLRQPQALVPDSVVSETAAEITNNRKEIEEAYYYYYRGIESICKPDQLKRFDSILVRKMEKLIKEGEDDKKHK